ncbi:hypothetical protein SAMN04490243_2531 [Robiginitalea myxolifaciens]|uniref:Uncharacterized protein n=1 Tax=Robiginitalea myxolifaciens TaxID=400055 RepID=A0A1I6HBV7_9FLAO|nr:hypothetical protein [Robiginitalea myxolifaciens]SFR51919.1 hypothetical protein SAMN04490243_2531 [Robiginitalea myxolifaciens]
MKNHSDLSDETFEHQFRSGSLNPALFSHEAHLRIAWLMINKYGIAESLQLFPLLLKNYVSILGAASKYNETLTVAALKAVYHFMAKSNSKAFPEFIEEFPQLNFEFKRLMRCHYSFDIYNLPLAKTNYLEPDLIPFD